MKTSDRILLVLVGGPFVLVTLWVGSCSIPALIWKASTAEKFAEMTSEELAMQMAEIGTELAAAEGLTPEERAAKASAYDEQVAKALEDALTEEQRAELDALDRWAEAELAAINLLPEGERPERMKAGRERYDRETSRILGEEPAVPDSAEERAAEVDESFRRLTEEYKEWLNR